MEAAYPSSNIVPWNVIGTDRSPAFNLIALTDMVDTTTKPEDSATNTALGRLITPCDAGGLCVVRPFGGEIEDAQFFLRVYTWSRVKVAGSSTDVWTAQYHGQATCKLGSMLVFGNGIVGGAGGNLYCDTITITNNSGLGSGMRVIGRDNGAGDGTVTPDQQPAELVFDRMSDELVELQIAIDDADSGRAMLKFTSGA